MFDRLPPEPAALRGVGEEAVVAAIEGWARLEAMVSARRLDAIAELTSRRCDKQGERAHWACDGWDSVAGEVSAALGVSPKKASAQMSLGLSLRQRLPAVAALYLAGKTSYRVVSTISWRTRLVAEESVGRVDAALAARAQVYDELSDCKLEQAVDFWVARHDHDALRQTRPGERSRELYIGKKNDDCDTTAVWGRLSASDAELLERRVSRLIDGICARDPRTAGERRADALGALAADAQRLACRCKDPDCRGGGDDGRAANFVIHVLTDSTTGAGVLGRDKIIPNTLLAELIASGATVREVARPEAAPEGGYVPSSKLAEFVRCRDLTCRFPGCEQPAEFCDIDHTIPHPVGPTHPSNLKCLCRKHHLLKTFWTGIDGWADQQLPDGTVIWKAPTGRTYKTLPGSRIFFPAFNTTTAPLAPPATPPPTNAGRALMMPRRRRTRAAERAQRIQDERKANAAAAAHWARQAAQAKAQATQRDKPPPDDIWEPSSHPVTDDDDPPPF